MVVVYGAPTKRGGAAAKRKGRGVAQAARERLLCAVMDRVEADPPSRAVAKLVLACRRQRRSWQQDRPECRGGTVLYCTVLDDY